MNLYVYQSYENLSDRSKLDQSFIAFDNTNNLAPHLREYPLQKLLYQKHRNTDAYWGIVSSRWQTKTCISGEEFIKFIVSNPGYDMYHIDPSIETSLSYSNLWIQGEECHGIGLIDFANKLFRLMRIDINVRELQMNPIDFSTTGYFVGNNKFWNDYYLFVDYALALCGQNEDLNNFLFKTYAPHGPEKDKIYIPFFCFVIERLLSVFIILHRHIRVKKFPVTKEWLNKKFSNKDKDYVDEMYNTYYTIVDLSKKLEEKNGFIRYE